MLPVAALAGRPGTPSRPGSASGSMKRANSMTRLPDDAPGTSIVDMTAARPSSTSSSTRKLGGSLKLGEDPLISSSRRPSASGTGSRPGSALSSDLSRGSMMALPAEIEPPKAAVAASLPMGGAGAGGGKSKMRERLKMNLTVAPPTKKSDTKQVFRTMKDSERIEDSYIFEEEIYSGGMKGRILSAKTKIGGEEVVVKVRAKQTNRSGERTWRTIMAQLHGLGTSNHVLGISEIIEGPEEFYIVMPKCNGGELFEFLANETEVPEAECKRIIREILTAVGHLHKNGIIHRDIKPENIMFDLDLTIEASPKTVKLIDFDTCQEWTPKTPKSRRFVGTPGYIAPEALLGQLSPQSDLWSVGVILYILMTGEMPWSSMVSLEDGLVGSASAVEMYKALKAEVVEWGEDPWPDFPLARDLCQKLLAFELDERLPDVWEALNHDWLKDAPQS